MQETGDRMASRMPVNAAIRNHMEKSDMTLKGTDMLGNGEWEMGNGKLEIGKRCKESNKRQATSEKRAGSDNAVRPPPLSAISYRIRCMIIGEYDDEDANSIITLPSSFFLSWPSRKYNACHDGCSCMQDKIQTQALVDANLVNMNMTATVMRDNVRY